jgi:hypothetical protein
LRLDSNWDSWILLGTAGQRPMRCLLALTAARELESGNVGKILSMQTRLWILLAQFICHQRTLTKLQRRRRIIPRQERVNEMNYYESVVVDYLRADRSLFVNTECCIQLIEADNPDTLGPHSHWYCDAVVADFERSSVFLCEITYSATLQALLTRLRAWNENWRTVLDALVRDSHLPSKWPVRPWLFVPEGSVELLLKGLKKISGDNKLNFEPKITPLEMVQPWEYRSWNRTCEEKKPDCIPLEMQN